LHCKCCKMMHFNVYWAHGNENLKQARIMKRTVKITYKVIEGADILTQGHELSRHLWNQLRWHQFGYNEKLRRRRGDSWEVYRRNVPHARGIKYLGNFGMQKVIKDHWSAKDLSDRCSSYTIKDFDIAMRSWFSNIKTNPKARPPRYTKEGRLLYFEVGRNARSKGDWTYHLTVLGRHIKDRHALVRLRIRPGVKMRDIKLIRLHPDGSGDAIINLEANNKVSGNGVAGVDLGIINMAAVAFQNGESILYSGKGLLASNQWHQKQAKACKPKNWQKGKAESRQSENFKRYRCKAGNIQKLAVHNLTRHIINECIVRQIRTLVLGDLRGIREQANHGKKGNQKLHNWPFAEIRRQLEYKAEEVGIETIAVSERNTSKCCHLCGQVGRRSPRGLLTCQQCGVVVNSDVNGAFNILNKVSPSPAYAGVGVGANLPGLPSPLPAVSVRIGKVQSVSQIHPTFVAKFDLRNWSIVQTRCNSISSGPFL